MPEQSHLDEMRAKIRGDRERAARRGYTVLARPEPTQQDESVTPDRLGVRARLRRALLGG